MNMCICLWCEVTLCIVILLNCFVFYGSAATFEIAVYVLCQKHNFMSSGLFPVRKMFS